MQIVIDTNVINYQDTKKGDHILLIMPGWKRSFYEWETIINIFKDRYRVIAVDFPGFGGSLRPKEDWDTFDYAKFIEKFLDKLNIKKCSIIGHSFGGRVGIILASGELKIDQLILLDAAGIEKKNIWLKLKIIGAKILKLILPNNIINKLLRGDYSEVGDMKEIFKKVVNQDLVNLLPKIKIQTFIIWGEFDKVLPLSHAKILHQLINKSILRIVWGATHDPHLEKPEQFIEILKETLTQN